MASSKAIKQNLWFNAQFTEYKYLIDKFYLYPVGKASFLFWEVSLALIDFVQSPISCYD